MVGAWVACLQNTQKNQKKNQFDLYSVLFALITYVIVIHFFLQLVLEYIDIISLSTAVQFQYY